MIKTRISLMTLCLTLALPVIASTTLNDEALLAVAVGRVAYQCGQHSIPPIFVAPQSFMNVASEKSGLSIPDVIQALKMGNSQARVERMVQGLKREIKAGRKACSDYI